MSSGLTIVPIFQKEAFRFISKNHDHHIPPVGTIFQIGLELDGELVGVATCGRPVGEKIDFKKVVEVTRTCVVRGGRKIPNANSKLNAACARIAAEMGYKKIITFTLESESGASYIASGWTDEGIVSRKIWNSSGKRIRTNVIDYPLFGETKQKYPDENVRRWTKILDKRYKGSYKKLKILNKLKTA